MTVSSSTNRVSYSGNGTLTTFAYTFKIFDEGDLTVILRAANGTETVQTITTHYTVTGAGSASGGNVEFVTAPSATETVVILREQDLTQGLDLVPNDPFPAQSLEESLDKLVFMVQQHEETLGRTIKASKTNEITGAEFTISAADRANKIFAFDGSGDVNITQAVGVYRGDWAASTSYAVRDIVKDTSNNNIYIANTAHTSSGSTPLSSNADIAKWDLLVDAASATSSASAAAASETAAQAAQAAAETAQTAAETAQTAAETAETNAETAQAAAETAQTAAEAAQTAAEAVYDNFDDRYLGAKATDPTLDNDGDALIDGALYFDTTNNVMKVYDLGGTAWKRTTPTSAEQTNIDTVSGISANVTTVAGISSDVTTVSGISADVTTVAADGTDIGVVAGISANVTTVAGISSNVTTVAGISSDVTTVAADGTDIGTVATNISNVNTVAGISGNVTTVAGISSDVTTVAADGADIGSVAGSISNVNTVATNLTNINTVAGISSNVTSVAGISADVTTVANNLSDVSNFASLYRIAASDPTTSLDEGDLYYNTTSDEMKVYNGSAWQAVAPTATSVTVSQVSDLTATAAEINQLDGTADLPDIRPSLLLDFANSKTLDPRITFTRGSTATYWDGKTTAKAEENLLTYSQDFLNATYGRNGVTVTTDAATAPDGTTTANNVVPSVASNYQSIQSADISTSGDQVQSVFVKSNGYTKVALRESNAGQYYVSFDLASGGSILDSSGATGSITDVGNGWFRISASATRTGNTRWSLYLLPSTYTSGNIIVQWSGDGTSSIYAWGAQLEERSSATAYTATTTSPIVKYQPVLQTAASGEARFDHDPVTGESKGLLIEEARTNLFPEDNPSASAWYKNESSVTANAATAPDGTNTASKIVENTATAVHYVSETITVTGDTTYTMSVFAKAGERGYLKLQCGFVSNWVVAHDVIFDLSDGSLHDSTHAQSVEGTHFGSYDIGNGWYRLWISGTTISSATAAGFNLHLATGVGNEVNYTGDGYSGVFVWGAQFEAGSFPTSYIPTSGSTVTRPTENAAITGTNFTDWYDNSRGFTVFAQIGDKGGWDSGESYGRIWSMSDNTEHNFIEVYGQIPPETDKWRYRVDALGIDNSVQADNYRAVSIADNQKIAIALDTDDFAISVGGQSVNTDTSTPLPTLNKLTIGSRSYGSSGTDTVTTGTIKKIAIYPKRLPNATLQAMTEA